MWSNIQSTTWHRFSFESLASQWINRVDCVQVLLLFFSRSDIPDECRGPGCLKAFLKLYAPWRVIFTNCSACYVTCLRNATVCFIFQSLSRKIKFLFLRYVSFIFSLAAKKKETIFVPFYTHTYKCVDVITSALHPIMQFLWTIISRRSF